MNIHWTCVADDAYVAREYLDAGRRKVLFSICKRGPNGPDDRDERTRWCVYDGDRPNGYCGEIPFSLGLNEDDLKAVATAIWRMR